MKCTKQQAQHWTKYTKAHTSVSTHIQCYLFKHGIYRGKNITSFFIFPMWYSQQLYLQSRKQSTIFFNVGLPTGLSHNQTNPASNKNDVTFEPIFSFCSGLIPYSFGITPSARSCNENIQSTFSWSYPIFNTHTRKSW